MNYIYRFNQFRGFYRIGLTMLKNKKGKFRYFLNLSAMLNYGGLYI